MKTKIKMYKPGQLLTIDGKVYRVKRKENSWRYVCALCDAKNKCFRQPSNEIMCKSTPPDCYLQLVKPKSSLG